MLAGLILWEDHSRKGAHLSFGIFGTIPFQHGEGAEAKEISKSFNFERLPVIHPIGQIYHSRREMFLVNGVVGRVQHRLDHINGFADFGLQFLAFRLLAKFLHSSQQQKSQSFRSTIAGRKPTESIRGYLVNRWNGLTKKPLSVEGRATIC